MENRRRGQMKKKISGILVIMMSISLCFGCGSDNDKKEKTSESIVSSSVQEDSTNESSDVLSSIFNRFLAQNSVCIIRICFS